MNPLASLPFQPHPAVLRRETIEETEIVIREVGADVSDGVVGVEDDAVRGRNSRVQLPLVRGVDRRRRCPGTEPR